MRVRSSSNVLSLSSKRGGSRAARRDTEFFARSQAICTCRESANMSGARRALKRTLGSNLRAVALASAFSSSPLRLFNELANTSTVAAWTVIFMKAPWGQRKASEKSGREFYLSEAWPACLLGETIGADHQEIGATLNLIWTPAQLAVLAKVVDLNGFSAAARALGVPKAAVSRAVADLEKSLGVKVLERTTRRISLTHAGRLLYPHAKRVVEESEAARAVIGKLNAPISGPLRVVADPTYGRVLLTPLVPRFLESFPDVPLDVSMDAPDSAEGWDVAIRTRLSAEGGFTFRLLGAPPALLSATPAYLQQRTVPVRPEDLRTHELLTPEATDPPQYRLRLERGTQRAEVLLSPKLAVNDPAVLHAATAAGLGIGLLPEFLCRQGLATGRLKQVLPEWTVPPPAALYAIYPAALEADLRVQRFVEFLAANIVPALGVTGE